MKEPWPILNVYQFSETISNHLPALWYPQPWYSGNLRTSSYWDSTTIAKPLFSNPWKIYLVLKGWKQKQTSSLKSREAWEPALKLSHFQNTHFDFVHQWPNGQTGSVTTAKQQRHNSTKFLYGVRCETWSIDQKRGNVPRIPSIPMFPNYHAIPDDIHVRSTVHTQRVVWPALQVDCSQILGADISHAPKIDTNPANYIIVNKSVITMFTTVIITVIISSSATY